MRKGKLWLPRLLRYCLRYENRIMQYTVKIEKVQLILFSYIFLVFAQNKDFRYMQGGSKVYRQFM